MPTRITRRRFLASGAAGATTAALTTAWAQDPPRLGANDEIRTAIIGLRGQGRHHIDYHRSDKQVRIAALCDPDENLFAERLKLFTGPPPKVETDLRRVFDDKSIDCVSIATPNHWHALAAIWALQAGKDVYVEKPMSYNIVEGRRVVEAVRKHNRVLQVGTQLRANTGRQAAMKLLREGLLGPLHMARAFFFSPRQSIGRKPDAQTPGGVNYDLWLGPAPVRPFNPNRFHYEWHWHWDYGNGEIGNNGPHLADIVIEGLGKQDAHPVKAYSQGGRFVWNDQGETPNTQAAEFRYADGTLAGMDIRNLPSNEECGSKDGVTFFGAKGYLCLLVNGTYRSEVDGKTGPSGKGGRAHAELAQNFYQVARSRKAEDLLAPAEYGHRGAALCHLANISYRLGRSVEFDPTSETFGRDAEANALLTRDYRKPFAVPDRV